MSDPVTWFWCSHFKPTDPLQQQEQWRQNGGQSGSEACGCVLSPCALTWFVIDNQSLGFPFCDRFTRQEFTNISQSPQFLGHSMTCSWQVFCSMKANKERENKNRKFPLVRFCLPQSYLLHSQLAETSNSVSIQDGKNLICTHEISPRAWINPTVGCLGIKPNQCKPINSIEGHPVKSARLVRGAFRAS